MIVSLIQEVGNIPYVVDNGAGVFSSSPKEAAKRVAKWFGHEREELKRLSQNALKLAQPNAVFDIVRDIHELVRGQSPVTRLTCTANSPDLSASLEGNLRYFVV